MIKYLKGNSRSEVDSRASEIEKEIADGFFNAKFRFYGESQ